MKSRRHVSVLDTNREHDGRAVHPAHLRTHRSPATVALPFALMCAIIGGGNICQSLSWDARRSQRVSAYLGVFGTCRRRLLSLCSDVRQVSILKHLRCEDGNLHRHRRVKCRASAGTNFRWTTTDAHRYSPNPHAACDVEGAGNGATERPIRARRGKPRIQTRLVLVSYRASCRPLMHYV